MSKLEEMIRRKKDRGFTLIELMIVIAVIGILAIVLVPKVGMVKTQAKTAGIETNMRAVEGYIQSNINKWANSGKTIAQVNADIIAAFGAEQIANPFTSTLKTPVAGTVITDPENNALFLIATDVDGVDLTTPSVTTSKGTIVLSSEAETAGGTIASIKLIPHGNNGLAAGTPVTITP